MPDPLIVSFNKSSAKYTVEQVTKAVQEVISGKEITEVATAHGMNVNTLRNYILNRPLPSYLHKSAGVKALLDQARDVILDRPRKFSPKQANHPSKRKL